MRNFQIEKLNKEMLGRILTIAEASLPPPQFRGFKKATFTLFHGEWKDRLNEILKTKDQVGAVPFTDNFDGKEF